MSVERNSVRYPVFEEEWPWRLIGWQLPREAFEPEFGPRPAPRLERRTVFMLQSESFGQEEHSLRIRG